MTSPEWLSPKADFPPRLPWLLGCSRRRSQFVSENCPFWKRPVQCVPGPAYHLGLPTGITDLMSPSVPACPWPEGPRESTAALVRGRRTAGSDFMPPTFPLKMVTQGHLGPRLPTAGVCSHGPKSRDDTSTRATPRPRRFAPHFPETCLSRPAGSKPLLVLRCRPDNLWLWP